MKRFRDFSAIWISSLRAFPWVILESGMGELKHRTKYGKAYNGARQLKLFPIITPIVPSCN